MRRFSVYCLAFWACIFISSYPLSADVKIDQKKLAEKAKALRKLEGQLTQAGKFDSYADMRVKLIFRFLDYLNHDIVNHREPLTNYEARDLNRMIDAETQRVKDILAGRCQPVVSPRRVTDDVPVIVGSHLEQKVKYPDGKIEKRPVFLFGFGHFGKVQQDIEFLAGLGCNFCQVELGPYHVWKGKNKWNSEVINRYAQFIKRADKAGVLVDLLLSPHYFPKWQYKEHPDWLAHSGGFNKFSLNRPGLRKFLKETFQREIKELSVSKNFRTVCVMNEPVFFNGWGDPDTRRLWEKYLQNKYGSIDELNERWETDYKGWGNVPDYKTTPYVPFKPEPALYDWMKFNDMRFANFIKWISDCVHQTKTNKLTHAKEMGREFTQYDVMQGANVYLISRATDMAGNDWGCIVSENDMAVDMQFALGYSIMHLATERPIVNTENHLIRGGTSDYPQNIVRASFWLQAIYGLDASAAWSWEKWDKPKGDWTLGMWLYRPQATEEYVRTGMDIMRLMPDILALRNAPCRVAILHSRTSALRNPKYGKYIKRTYSVLQEMGIRADAITEQMITNHELMKKLPDLKVLILAGTTYLPDDVYNNIRILAANTGVGLKIVGVGRNIGKFNEFAQKREVEIANDTAIIYRQIKFGSRDDLWKRLDIALRNFGITRKFVLIDESDNQPVRGVFYRTAIKNGKVIATIVNLTNKSIVCHWTDSSGKKLAFTDKLSLRNQSAKIRLNIKPLDVFFGGIK